MRESHFAADGGDVHDAALAPAPHAGKDSQGGVNRAPEVDAHDVLEIFQGHMLERADENRSGVIDQHLDGA